MMNAPECAFEEEVLAAALQSRWPDRVPSELRAHVESCSLCRDLAEVSGAISEMREEMRPATVLPDAGRIWWMTQLRARREAIQTAGRPITAVHIAALGCAAGLAGACFGATSAWFQSVLNWLASRGAPSAWDVVAQHSLLAAAMAVLLLAVPAAVYLAIGRE